jgi:hypothetical protein
MINVPLPPLNAMAPSRKIIYVPELKSLSIISKAVSVGELTTHMKKTTSAQYVGGCIFVDHGSGYIQVRNQVAFSAVETIRAKQSYEQFALIHGIIVKNYLTESGAFKAKKNFKFINETQQRLRFCGTNAHHQNGVAERAIQTFSSLARAMILHASVHWKDGVDASLWPMAV